MLDMFMDNVFGFVVAVGLPIFGNLVLYSIMSKLNVVKFHFN